MTAPAEAQPRFQTIHYLRQAISIRNIRHDFHEVDGANTKLAVVLTAFVGSMWCAYLFTLIALVSLPATLVHAGWISPSAFPSWMEGDGLISFIGWLSSYFIQLVLLSVIIVGQNVQAASGDAVRNQASADIAQVREGMTTALDQLNLDTKGGLQVIRDNQATTGQQLNLLKLSTGDGLQAVRDNQATTAQQLNLLKLQLDGLLRHLAPEVRAELAARYPELHEEVPGDDPPA